MRNIEFNKTKDEILNIICQGCGGETRHKVLQSVDITGSSELSDTYWIDWTETYQIL